jgi:hypothetical protein
LAIGDLVLAPVDVGEHSTLQALQLAEILLGPLVALPPRPVMQQLVGVELADRAKDPRQERVPGVERGDCLALADEVGGPKRCDRLPLHRAARDLLA